MNGANAKEVSKAWLEIYWIQNFAELSTTQDMLHFLLTTVNNFLLSHTDSFSSRRGFISILVYKKEVFVSLPQKVAQPVILENIRKPLIHDFSLDANLSPASSVSIAFGDVNVLKKI